MTSPRVDWLIYALGGGLGHLTRACALARKRSGRGRILTNSPYAGLVRRSKPELDIVDASADVVERIEEARPDCLIVDTFPRGLVGELMDLLSRFRGSKTLVKRDLNPRYSAAFGLDEFVRNTYDHVIPAEDPHAPLLVRSADQLMPRRRAREMLGLDHDRPCVIVCAAGMQDELSWYQSVFSMLLDAPLAVRCVTPIRPAGCPREYWVSYWPAMDFYRAADVVVGGGGYNTVYEFLACRIPLVARPWPRKYDRQHLRAATASRCGPVTVVETVEQAVEAALERAVLASKRAL
jgi:hypothetical protein